MRVLFISLFTFFCVSFRIEILSSSNKQVNFGVFGNNNIGYNDCLWNQEVYDNCVKNNNIYSTTSTDYGNGVWNITKKSEKITLVFSEIMTSVLRFPGGCGAHLYNWSETVGENRDNYIYGIEEFLSICEDLTIEPLFTLSFFQGTNDDLMELIDFLLAEDSPRRVKSSPYSIKYFEFGNEVYHGDHWNSTIALGIVSPIEYANRYKDFRSRIKQKYGEQVQLGIILEAHYEMLHDWNKKVLEIVGTEFDFANPHLYPFGNNNFGEDLNVDPKKVFKYGYASSTQVFQVLDDYFFPLIGDKLIAVTEFNGGFVQENPFPYRHSFGNSLLVADMLINFVHYSDKILFANYWHFANAYWGLIYTENYYNNQFNRVIYRPNYFIFEFFKKFIGGSILKTNITNPKTYYFDDFDSDITDCCNGFFRITTRESILDPEELNDDFVINPDNWEEISDPSFTFSKTQNDISVDFVGDDIDFFHLYTKKINVTYKKGYYVSFEVKAENLVEENDIGVCFIVQDGRENGWQIWTYLSIFICFKGNYNDFKFVKFDFQTPKDTNTTSVQFLLRRFSKFDGKIVSGRLQIRNIVVSERNPFQPLSFVNSLATLEDENNDNSTINLVLLNKETDNDITVNLSFENRTFIIVDSWELHEELDYHNEDQNNRLSIKKDVFPENGEKVGYSLDLKPHSLVGIRVVVKKEKGGSVNNNDYVIGIVVGVVSFVLLLLFFLIITFVILILIFRKKNKKEKEVNDDTDTDDSSEELKEQ